MPFWPTTCSSTSAPSRFEARDRRARFLDKVRVERAREAAVRRQHEHRRAPHARRLAQQRETLREVRRVEARRSPRRARARTGAPPITRSCARFIFEVATISMVRVIFRVFSTDLIRPFSSRPLAIYVLVSGLGTGDWANFGSNTNGARRQNAAVRGSRARRGRAGKIGLRPGCGGLGPGGSRCRSARSPCRAGRPKFSASRAAAAGGRRAGRFVVRFDPDAPYVLDPANLHSRCRNTPFDSPRRMEGVVKLTLVAGEIAHA